MLLSVILTNTHVPIPATDKHLEAVDAPEHFPELFQLVVGNLCADGLQPLRHETLPQRLTDYIVGYETEDPIQALLQLGYCAT